MSKELHAQVLGKMSSDPSFETDVKSCTTLDDLFVVLTEAGFDLPCEPLEEEFEYLFNQKACKDVNQDHLHQISGGKGNQCKL
jgi:hypothetical protein